MIKREIEIDGKHLALELPEPAEDKPSFFVFSAHKSGSTLLNRMVTQLCKTVDFPIIDFPVTYFRAGLSIDRKENVEPLRPFLREKGYAYLGARTFWCRELGLDFSLVKKILLVRDPRDAIVSWYFSDKKAHAIPKAHRGFRELRERLQKGDDINDNLEYLQSRARSLEKLGVQYRELIASGSIAVYRYEDVIFRKRSWLNDINQFLELGVDKARVFEIADENDIVPSAEDENKFIRQVYPGNHIKHLSPQVIDILNAELSGFLESFRYNQVDRFVVR